MDYYSDFENFTVRQAKCKLGSASVTSTQPNITLTMKNNITGNTILTLTCNTSTAYYVTTTVTNPSILSTQGLSLTASTASGTIDAVQICYDGYK